MTADYETSRSAAMAPEHRPDSLDRAESLRLLGQAKFGRLALPAPGRPAILPVRIRAGAGPVLVAADPSAGAAPHRGAPVALEVDCFDSGAPWSVILTGTVVGPVDGVSPGRWFMLDLTSISGRRLSSGAEDAEQPADVPVVLPAPGPLTRTDAYRLLDLQPVGRLAVAPGGYPQIFPVNYVLDGEAVVFRTGTGTKLHALSRSLVAFEADWVAPTGEGWSVVISGWAQEVTPAEPQLLQARVRSLPLHPWVAGDRPYYVRVVPVEVTGWSLRWD